MMLKKLIYISLAISLFLCTSCERKYEDTAKVTYFVEMTMHGEPLIYLPSGQEYVDSGITVIENGVEIDPVIINDVDVNVPARYIIEYIGTNAEGYSKTLTRQVNVYDAAATVDLSGEYTGDVDRNGSESYGGISVTLTKIAGLNGVYELSDWISGFYSEGRGYGEEYNFTGIIHITSDNKVIEFDMSNPWGDPFDEVVGTYDEGTQTISYTADWIGYQFVVNLVK